MGEEQVIEQLQGPMGGVFALGMLIGSVMMWAANLKLIKPWVDRAHTAELATLLARIEGLESRVKQLEVTESEHYALLRRHAQATLAVREQH